MRIPRHVLGIYSAKNQSTGATISGAVSWRLGECMAAAGMPAKSSSNLLMITTTPFLHHYSSFHRWRKDDAWGTGKLIRRRRCHVPVESGLQGRRMSNRNIVLQPVLSAVPLNCVSGFHRDCLSRRTSKRTILHGRRRCSQNSFLAIPLTRAGTCGACREKA